MLAHLKIFCYNKVVKKTKSTPKKGKIRTTNAHPMSKHVPKSQDVLVHAQLHMINDKVENMQEIDNWAQPYKQFCFVSCYVD